MAFIQRHQHLGSSIFCQLEAKYLKQLLTSTTVTVFTLLVVDMMSPQLNVWKVRNGRTEWRWRIQAHDTLTIPGWKNFVRNLLNKANLLNNMGEAWAAQNKSLSAGCTLILGGIIPGRTLLLWADCHVGVPVVLWEAAHGGIHQNVCRHCIFSTTSAPQTGCTVVVASLLIETWSWCACTTSRTWMAYMSCGWIRWIITYPCNRRSSGSKVWYWSCRSYIHTAQHVHTDWMWHSELSLQKREKACLRNCCWSPGRPSIPVHLQWPW